MLYYMSDTQNSNLPTANTLAPRPTSTPSSTPIDAPWYSNFMILISVIMAGLCGLSLIIGLIGVATGSFFSKKNQTFVVDNPMHSRGGYFYSD